ncbi:MAG: hypothetical protein MJ137_08705 [Clostridia bacterium]|nr:hypothetical protein [Clostridia bacterium]
MTAGDWVIVVLCFAGLIAAAVWIIGSLGRRKNRGRSCGCHGGSEKPSSSPRRADGSKLDDEYSGNRSKNGSSGCSGDCTHCSGCH